MRKIRVAILVAEAPSSSVRALYDAHRRLGHDVAIAYLGTVYLRADLRPVFPGPPPDVAHSRASAMWSLPVQDSLAELIPIVNTVEGQRAGRDKWLCAKRLNDSAVPALPTLLALPGADPQELWRFWVQI
jgi:hypothetical protein